MDLSVGIVNTISDISPKEWDVLSADSLYACHRWLAFVARDPAANCRYVTVRADRQLVAALPCYQVLHEENEFYDPQLLLDGRWPGKYLIAGGRRGYVNTFPVRPTLAGSERGHVLDTLLSEAQRVAGELALDGALLLYLTGGAAAELADLRAGVRPQLTSMDADLTLPGSGFEDYLSALHKQARTNARREIATYRAADLATGFERIGDCYEEAAPLLRQLQARYGHAGADEHYRRMLRRHAEALDDLSLVITARRGGRLTAFALFYLWGDTMYLRLAGFDYPMLADAFEYFNVAFYEPIEWGYRHGYRRIHLGRESYDAKLRRGARLRPMLSAELPVGAGAPAQGGWNRRQLAAWRLGLPAELAGQEWTRWID